MRGQGIGCRERDDVGETQPLCKAGEGSPYCSIMAQPVWLGRLFHLMSAHRAIESCATGNCSHSSPSLIPKQSVPRVLPHPLALI